VIYTSELIRICNIIRGILLIKTELDRELKQLSPVGDFRIRIPVTETKILIA
jgi:hypothetical protein